MRGERAVCLTADVIPQMPKARWREQGLHCGKIKELKSDAFLGHVKEKYFTWQRMIHAEAKVEEGGATEHHRLQAREERLSPVQSLL